MKSTQTILSNTLNYESLQKELSALIKKYPGDIEKIKSEYEKMKNDFIKSEKEKQYQKNIKDANFYVFYPDIVEVPKKEELSIEIRQRKRAVLFTEWYKNHFPDKKPIDNIDLVEYQKLLFNRLKNYVEEGQDSIISKKELKAIGQDLFKDIIDSGEGVWGGYQLNYVLSTLVEQTEYKHAKLVHKEKFSRILFSAFAEGSFLDNIKLKK